MRMVNFFRVKETVRLVLIVCWLVNCSQFIQCDDDVSNDNQIQTAIPNVSPPYVYTFGDNFTFSCSGYCFKTFTCYWDFQDYNPEAVYDLHMTSVENSSYSSCFNLTEKDHCTFDLIKLSSNYVNENRFRFRLDVIDRFGTISKFFAYDHYANVVLCQVTEVKIVELGTRFVYLTWKPPMEIYTRYYLSKSITYQLDIYQIENDQKTIGSTSNKVKYLRSAQLIGATDFKIINLIQSTKYRIDIRCQLTSNSRVNRLGEKVTVDIITKTDAFSINIPNLYPEVFELIKKEDDLLDVVVYLDRVDLTPDLQPKYEKIMIKVSPMLISSKIKIPVNVVPVGQPKKIPDLKPWNLSSISIPDSYYFDDKYAEKSNRSQKITRVKPAMTILPCRPSLTTKSNQIHYLKASEIDFTSCIIENLNTITDYQMQLVAYNSIEPTIGPIISKIPAHSLDKIHPGVDQFYAIDWGHHNYTLEWTVPSIQQVAKYTICLCEVSNLNFQCDGRIETFDLPGNQTSLELTINKDYQIVQFGIGVTDLTYELASGIKWAQCIESALDIRVDNRFKRFDLIPIGSKSIKAIWQLDCPALDYFIDHYEIHYCPIDFSCSEKLKIISVNKSTLEYIIDLDSKTFYNFTIRGVTSNGDNLESPTITFQTEFEVIPPAMLTIFSISLISLIVIFSYTLIVIKRRQVERKLKENVDSNWIPKMPPRLKGDANILLDTLYEMNTISANNHCDNETISQQLTKENVIATINVDTQSSSSSLDYELEGSRIRTRKISDYVECDSHDSGYSINKLSSKNQADQMDEPIDQYSPYIVIPEDSKSVNCDQSDSDLSYNYQDDSQQSTNYDPSYQII